MEKLGPRAHDAEGWGLRPQVAVWYVGFGFHLCEALQWTGLDEKLFPLPVLCFASCCEGFLFWGCTGRKEQRRSSDRFGPKHKGSMIGCQQSDPAHRFGFPQKQTDPTIVSLVLLPQELQE